MPTNKDYIPGPDQELNQRLINFIAYANTHLAPLGLVAGDIANLVMAAGVFTTSLTTLEAARTAGEAATQAKNDAREAVVLQARALVNRLQASPVVDDAERAALGITVRDRSPTPVSAPSTSPIAIVSTATRLKHTLRIADETTPTRRAKPQGVAACQVWFKVGGAPPANESELTLPGIFTRSTIENAFVMDQGNEPVYYRVRWLNAKGEPGPWSEIVAATIAA